MIKLKSIISEIADFGADVNTYMLGDRKVPTVRLREEVATIEMVCAEIESGYDAEVISLVYAEFQFAELAMRLSASVPIHVGVKV